VLWREEEAVSENSLWAAANVTPWWEALSNCSMVLWLLSFPCPASQPTVAETEPNDGRSVPEQWLGRIMDQETILKLPEIEA